MGVKIITCTWDEVPHLTKEVKDDLYAGIPPYQRDARTKGIPVLGSGLIYPVPEEDIGVDDFPIPDKWPRGFAMDVGWNKTAGLWGARNPETRVLYIYSCHYQGREEPAIHVEAFKARGALIPGVIDPRSDGRSQIDGKQLFKMYREMGLNLEKADNSVEAGIYAVWQLMVGGMLKVFRSLKPFWEEIRMYRRDEKGSIVKERDHVLDCLRYLVMSGIDRMKTMDDRSGSSLTDLLLGSRGGRATGAGGWMGY